MPIRQALRVLGLQTRFFLVTPWRYPLDTLGFYVFTFMLFSGLIIGVVNFTPLEHISVTKGAILLSYVFWLLYVMTAHSAATSIATFASQGVLERELITPLGHLRAILLWLSARYLAYVPQYLVLVTILVAVFQVPLPLAPPDFLWLLAVLLTSFLFFAGISLIFGGLALVFKQVVSVIGIFQFLFFTLSLATTRPLGWLDSLFQWFPYTQAIRVLLMIAGDKELPWTSALYELGVLGGSSLLFFAVGLLVFRWMDRVAMERGLLGQY